jgi:hypothetical protein
MATNLLIALRADSADFSEHPLMQKANRSVLQTAACPLCRVTTLEWGGGLASDASPRPQAKPENTGQTPEGLQGRAGPAKIEFTVDAFMAGTVYEAMSREDFCDAVLTALRAGNLSDDEATLAVYAREWVLSGADRRTSFPEWMPTGEVLDRLAVLQREWLQAARQDTAVKRMSFNEWLAATDKRRPAGAEGRCR